MLVSRAANDGEYEHEEVDDVQIKVESGKDVFLRAE